MNPQQPDNPQVPVGPTPPEQPTVTPDVSVPESQPLPAVEPQPSVAPETAAPAPVAEPQVAPALPVDPVQPVAPQPFPSSPAAQDEGAVPPQQPPVGGPAVFGTGPAPAPAKNNNKLITLIVAAVGGLVAIGLIVWVLFAFVFNSIALESYKGDNYSVLVPKEYEKEESASSVAFKEPDADSDEQSQMMVTSIPIKDALTVMSRADMIKLYDDAFSEDNLSESSGFSSSNTITNFTKDETEYQGFDARKISFDVEKDGKRSGSGHVLLVFADDAFYAVVVAAHTSDPALGKAADKILNSLEIDE